MTKIIVRSNQSSVNPTASGQRVGVEYNDAGNRAAANMYGTIGKAFNAGLDVLNKEQEQNEALRVAKATNEFNLELGKLKVDYMQKRQGSNSAGVINDFLKDANVLSERIYAKSGIRYKLGEQAFKRITDNTLATDGVQLYKFQEQETQKYKQNVFDQSADNLINGVIDGESLLENYPIMEGLYRSMFPDLPKEQYKQVETEMANRYAAILVNDAVNQNNYTLAEDRLSYFRNKISPEVRTKLEAALYSEQEYVENSELSKQLVDIPPDEWDAYLENYAKGKGNITEGKYTFNPGVSFEGMQENAVQGIKGITGILNQYGIDDVYITSTKNDYSGHAPGSAHYEGVGVDVDSTKLGELDESSRNILADRMERAYPGLKVLNEYDDPSDYATAGHFHLDFTNYKGESRLGASGLSARRRDQIKQMAETMMSDNKRRIKEQNDAITSSAFAEVIKMHDEGVSYEDAQAWARNKAGTNLELFNTFTGLVNRYYSSVGAKGNGGKGLAVGMENLFEDFLTNGTYAGVNGKQEFIDDLLKYGATKAEVNEMLKVYDDWNKGTGMFKYNWDNIKLEIMGEKSKKDADVYAAQCNEAQAAGKEFIKQYRIKNNRMPTEYEIIQAARESLTKKSYGSYRTNSIWPWASEKDLELSSGQLARAGIKEISKRSDGMFEVIYSDGRMSDIMSGKDIETLFAVGKVK